jgi:hypothetical protein
MALKINKSYSVLTQIRVGLSCLCNQSVAQEIEVYARISSITATKQGQRVIVDLHRLSDMVLIERMELDCLPFNTDLGTWPQAYEALKSLPEFAGAKNV